MCGGHSEQADSPSSERKSRFLTIIREPESQRQRAKLHQRVYDPVLRANEKHRKSCGYEGSNGKSCY
jgi:hypothetical protein